MSLLEADDFAYQFYRPRLFFYKEKYHNVLGERFRTSVLVLLLKRRAVTECVSLWSRYLDPQPRSD